MNSCLAILPLLAAAAALSQGATINRAELRCQCINTQSKPFSSKQIANIELTPQGPHCVKMEVIATLKDGNQICLDYQAKWVKKIIHSLLHRSSNSK